MIIRTTYFARINNKGKLQLAMVQLDRNESTYSVYRTTWQVHGKEREYNPIFLDKKRNSGYIVRESFKLYERCKAAYRKIGYVPLDSLTDKTIEELEEEELKDLLGQWIDPKFRVPKLVRPVKWDAVAVSTLDKEWYITPKMNGVRCLIYYDIHKLQIVTEDKRMIGMCVNHLLTDDLLELFSSKEDLILDCMLYNHHPKITLEYLTNLSNQEEWSEECKDLDLYVLDYISEEDFSDRYELLQEMFASVTNPQIHLCQWKTIDGFYKIDKQINLAAHAGYPGIYMKANREYGAGRKSALLFVEASGGTVRKYVIKKYWDRENVIMYDTYDKTFKAAIAGPCNLDVDYYDLHSEELEGRAVNLLYFDYNSQPVNPIIVELL